MSGVKKQATTGKKAKAQPKEPNARRPLNPLPPDVVGPRLLVRLQAEKIMDKLHLKEAWDGADGWSFEDLCAVVACALGDGFVETGEKLAARRVGNARAAKLIRKIQAKALPPLTYLEGGTEDIRPEAYEGLLIMGLGTPEIPFERRGVDDTAQLCHGLARCLAVDESRVKARTFERAKKNALQRYNQHLERQEVRRERTMSQAGRTKRLPQGLLLKAAFTKLGLKVPGSVFNPRGPR